VNRHSIMVCTICVRIYDKSLIKS